VKDLQRQRSHVPHDGQEFKGTVVLTEVHTSGNKVRVESGDFILNVDAKQGEGR
jgi:hypothetical protein